MGDLGGYTMSFGIQAMRVIHGGCARRSGFRSWGGLILSIGNCLIFSFFVPSAGCLRSLSGFLKNGRCWGEASCPRRLTYSPISSPPGKTTRGATSGIAGQVPRVHIFSGRVQEVCEGQGG